MKSWRFWAAALGAFGGLLHPAPATAQESALAEAKNQTRQSPTSADASIAYGRALRRAGHANEALTEVHRGQSFAKGEGAIMAEWEIARTYIAKRDFNAAMGSCAAIKKLPNGGAANHACAAEAHLLWRRGTEATAEIAEVLKAAGVSNEVLYATRISEGRARELDSKDAEAEAAYREALRLFPDRAEAHTLLGALLVRTGKDGLPELKRATDLDARDPVAQLEYGRALAADRGGPSRVEAVRAFERAVAERPSYLEALRAVTEAYVADNRLSDAKGTAAALLKIAPSDVLAHVVSGRVALAEGKVDDALKEGETALKLMPNEAKAKLLVADAYAKKGEIDLALEAYQKASGLDPNDATPLINATYACLAHNRTTSAKAYGQRAALDFPNQAAAWIANGDALAADGDPKAARAAYESAKKAKGADIAAIDRKLAQLSK